MICDKCGHKMELIIDEALGQDWECPKCKNYVSTGRNNCEVKDE